MTIELDHRVRLAAFQWLRAQMDIHGEVLPRAILAEGLVFEGRRVPLLGPQGIFKPGIMTEAPLSISTIPGGPYDDGMGSGGLLNYAYRGTDPAHPDNRGLRRAMEQRLPLVYFYRLQPGQYLAAFPVFIVGDRPGELAFDVAVDDLAQLVAPAEAAFDGQRGSRRHPARVRDVDRAAACAPAGIPGASDRGISDPLRVLPAAASGAVGCGSHHGRFGRRPASRWSRTDCRCASFTTQRLIATS